MAIMWHGGNRWDGAPEIRTAKRGRAEWGPGIYGTTNYFRASGYAKGGKVTHLIEFEPRLFLSQAAIGLDTLTEFVRTNAPRGKQADILGRLEDAASRNKTDNRILLGDGAMVHADVIVNMWVNTDLAHGKRGPVLAAFLTEVGIDAHSERSMSLSGEPEHWSVIFNPDVITQSTIYSAKQVNETIWQLPAPTEAPTLTLDEHLANIAGGDEPVPTKRSSMGM